MWSCTSVPDFPFLACLLDSSPVFAPPSSMPAHIVFYLQRQVQLQLIVTDAATTKLPVFTDVA